MWCVRDGGCALVVSGRGARMRAWGMRGLRALLGSAAWCEDEGSGRCALRMR